MAKHLNRKVGEMSYDKLIAGISPATHIASGSIAPTDEEITYPRGTVFAKSSDDGKLYVLGTEAAGDIVLTPDCILCDDTVVNDSDDVLAAFYVAGYFNVNALVMAEDYELKEADKDKLRERGIYLGQLFD